MEENMPIYDVPMYRQQVAGGAFAVAVSAARVEKLDFRDLPNPPAQVLSGPGRKPG